MITQNVKIYWVNGKPYLTANRKPVIGDHVVERLIGGGFDLFQIDTLNDIDRSRQYPVVATYKQLEYHFLNYYIEHDHIIMAYENGCIEEIYDLYNTLSKHTACKIIMSGQNEILKIHGKVIIVFNG